MTKTPFIVLIVVGLLMAGVLMAFAPKNPGPEITRGSSTMTLTQSAIGGGTVIEGSPKESGSGRLGIAKDDSAYAAIWECTPGKFSWSYGWDEIVFVIEGRVTLTHDGKAQEVRAGDLVTFHAGSTVIWDVHEKTRKVAFLHRPSRLGRLWALLQSWSM